MSPVFKKYIWGGRKLIDEYNKVTDLDRVAETWELSCYPNNETLIKGGQYDGIYLSDFINEHGWNILGTNCSNMKDFPLLIKLIDAKENLSIQVHPDDAFCEAHKNPEYKGKAEMWHILEAEPGASIYYGLKKNISKEEFVERIKSNTLEEVLNKEYVHVGDTFYIPEGTLHAIGRGIVLAEVQRSSNCTFRVYDYGRLGLNGRPRDLHVSEAIEVASLSPVNTENMSKSHLWACEHFIVDLIQVSGRKILNSSASSFQSLLITSGEGSIDSAEHSLPLKKGDCLFISAEEGSYALNGEIEALLSYIPDKEMINGK